MIVWCEKITLESVYSYIWVICASEQETWSRCGRFIYIQIDVIVREGWRMVFYIQYFHSYVMQFHGIVKYDFQHEATRSTGDRKQISNHEKKYFSSVHTRILLSFRKKQQSTAISSLFIMVTK